MPEVKIITTPSLFKVDDAFEDQRFMKVRIAAMHSGENLNGSSFSTKVIKDAKDSFANIAILANVVESTDEDGNVTLDYGGHDMRIEDDVLTGEERIIYDEKVVGIVPETNNFEIVHDDEQDVDFAYVDALLYRDYGNYAVDVLEQRGGQTAVSAEIYCDDISINASTHVLEVGKMQMSGITLLGESVTPAMKGANASVFSLQKDDRDEQLLKIMQELKQSLDNYTAILSQNGNENSKEGGSDDVRFEELLEQYGKTAEDITFDYEGLSDEELEAKFAEAFSTDEDDSEPEGEPEVEGVEEVEEVAEEEPSINYSVEYNGLVTSFSVSLTDKLAALCELVNDTYSDDGTWYNIDVFDDDKYVIMVDCWSGKAYKQSYKVKKDSYSLTGDRVPVKAVYLTEDEQKQIDTMRANYSANKEKLDKYEAEPSKMQILNSDEYSDISDSEEFRSLMENHFDLSVEEVEQKANELLLNAAKSHKLFSARNKKSSMKPMPTSRKQKQYGTIFDNITY